MTMFTDTRNRSLSLQAMRVLEFLHARLSRRNAIEDLDALSDRTLADVGLDRSDIAGRIDTETSRIGRLGLGR
jgi:uncharacterized protein YjiS (DUF1127 family)